MERLQYSNKPPCLQALINLSHPRYPPRQRRVVALVLPISMQRGHHSLNAGRAYCRSRLQATRRTGPGTGRERRGGVCGTPATIRERGTARVILLPVVFIGWAGTAIAEAGQGAEDLRRFAGLRDRALTCVRLVAAGRYSSVSCRIQPVGVNDSTRACS